MPHPLANTALTRTIIVGLGSTGLKVLQAFQDYWFERFGNTSTSLLKLVNIESDINHRFRATAEGSMITQIFMDKDSQSLEDLGEELIQLGDNPLGDEVSSIPWEWQWTGQMNWAESQATAHKLGMGGIRALGRMCLYGRDDENPDRIAKTIFTKIRRIVDHEWESVTVGKERVKKAICRDLGYSDSDWDDQHPDENPTLSAAPKVIVTGSLGGGTASGIYLDIGYILQGALRIGAGDLSKRLYGVFLIPNKAEDIVGEAIDYSRVNGNTFGALYELRRLLRRFKERQVPMPYGSLYICAPEYNHESDQHMFSELSGLIDMVALRLFSYCLGFQACADADLIDEYLNNPDNYVFSFGTGAVIFPKFTLIQRGAHDILGRFCNMLMNEEEYFDDKGDSQRIDLNVIKEHVEKRVDDFSREIFDNLTREPDRAESLNDKISEWVEKLRDDQHNKIGLRAEYVERSGFYYGLLKNNRDVAFKRVEENLKEDLAVSFAKAPSMKHMELLLDFYDKQFNKLKTLLEDQGCHLASEHVNKLIGSALREFKGSRSLSHARILESRLKIIFYQFVLSNEHSVILDLLESLDAWKKRLNIARRTLSTKILDFEQEAQRYKDRLVSNPRYSPVVKVYHHGPEKDYKGMLEGLLEKGNQQPGWRHFAPEVGAKEFWNGVLDGDIPFGRMRKVLEGHLQARLNDHLHPDGDAAPFNIIDKVLAPEHRREIEEMFAKVRLGFLKQKQHRDNSKIGPLVGGQGRIPRYVMSKASQAQLRSIVDEFSLDFGQGDNCGIYTCPLMEDMVVYTRDISSVRLDRLQKFEALKNAFLKKPARIEGLSHEKWTRLRLTMDGDIDYSLIEEARARELERILGFVRYFWFDHSRQASADGRSHVTYHTLTVASYNVPLTAVAGDGSAERDGCAVDRDGWRRLYFTEPTFHARLALNLEQPSKDDLNTILRQAQVYDALIAFVRSNCGFKTKDDRLTYLKGLHAHFTSVLCPAVGSDPQEVMKLGDYLFSPRFPAQLDASFNIDQLQGQECLVGDMMKLLN